MNKTAKKKPAEITLKAPLSFPDGTPEGTFLINFSVYNKMDSQGDVMLPGSIPSGQRTTLVWSHMWETWVGDGVTATSNDGANLAGSFWMDTLDGEQAYRKVKHRGDMQEYSFGFRILEADFGEFEGQGVRFVKRVELYEVSPVLIGAMRDTHTIALKRAESPKIPWAHVRRLLAKEFDLTPGAVDALSLEDLDALMLEHDDDTDDGGTPTPERFAEQLDRVLVDLAAMSTRATSILDLRAKEGRTFSAANVERITAIGDQTIALGGQLHDLVATSPPAKDDGARGLELLRLRTEYQRTMQRLRAEGITA